MERMTPELLRRIKAYLRLIIATLIISGGLVYATCYFNNCTLLQAFSLQETTVVTCIAIVANVLVIGTCALILFMNTLPLPKLPGGPWAREELIICKYSEGTFIVVSIFCFLVGIGMLCGACFSLLRIGASQDAIIGVLSCGVLGPAFLLLGSVFVLFVKNYMLIFYPEGVYYQNLLGKAYTATNEQIEYVSIISGYKERSLRLHTVDKDLCINWYCSEFFKAEKYALSRYIDFASYLEQQESAKNR